jgi:hypothetical protein
MVASSARVVTDRPTRYLKKVCEHFADVSRRHSDQEFEVAFDDGEGFIDFAPGRQRQLPAGRHQKGACWCSTHVGPTMPRSSACSGSSPNTSSASDGATG